MQQSRKEKKMARQDLQGKGPLVIGPDGKATDNGLFDMEDDDAYDRLLTIRLAKKAAKRVLEQEHGIKESIDGDYRKLYESLLN